MPLLYQTPGNADQLSKTLLSRWNSLIQQTYQGLRDYQSTYFRLNPQTIVNGRSVPITWFADPATPAFCKDLETAQLLADWGVKGRQSLHDEYCEYIVIQKPDKTGRLRPKRVQVTTEMREYWVMLAIYAPTTLRNLAASILGFTPSWRDLYGVDNPTALSDAKREIYFSRQMAGNGGRQDLAQQGVPNQPVGKLNAENALFMTSPVNGLDDLLFIIMFGSHPYAQKVGNQYERVTKEQIFRYHQTEQFACRHADPAASMSVYEAVFEGGTIAFADPLGLYIHSFSANVFAYNDQGIPAEWVRISRGAQRLEFGPGDDDDVFLDDLTVSLGGDVYPLTGGFQVVQQLEIGPNILFGDKLPVTPQDYIVMQTSDEPIRCNESKTCQQIDALHQEYLKSHTNKLVKVAPRQLALNPTNDVWP